MKIHSDVTIIIMTITVKIIINITTLIINIIKLPQIIKNILTKKLKNNHQNNHYHCTNNETVKSYVRTNKNNKTRQKRQTK